MQLAFVLWFKSAVAVGRILWGMGPKRIRCWLDTVGFGAEAHTLLARYCGVWGRSAYAVGRILWGLGPKRIRCWPDTEEFGAEAHTLLLAGYCGVWGRSTNTSWLNTWLKKCANDTLLYHCVHSDVQCSQWRAVFTVPCSVHSGVQCSQLRAVFTVRGSRSEDVFRNYRW